MPVTIFVEDLEGALVAGQDGLVRRVGRSIAEACAVVVNIVESYERPIPPPSQRAAWALERLRSHDVWDDCWPLLKGSDESAEQTAERCRRLVARTRELVGEIPDVLTPEGYFPALALARDWLKLLDAVGEEGFLPKDWLQGA
jgi:hypothetical protein